MEAKQLKTKEIWGEIDKLVEGWLKERQSLILLLCAVDGLREYTPRRTPVGIKIQAFCEVLMDYVSAGHFEVYEKLCQEGEVFGDDIAALTDSLYPKINVSTETALWFNDKYQTVDDCEQNLTELSRDMSIMAEQLSERFDLEDQLINTLHLSHRDLVA